MARRANELIRWVLSEEASQGALQVKMVLSPYTAAVNRGLGLLVKE